MPIKLEDLIPGGKSEKVENTPKKGADDNELQKGIKVEMEHIPTLKKVKDYYIKNKQMPPDKLIATWIAEDHLKEFPDYYTRLQKMENTAKLNESKVGDFYIQIGEAIEKIDSAYNKLSKLLNKIPRPKKGPIPILMNLEKIERGIYDLKKTFGESYDFGREKRGYKSQIQKYDVEDLVNALDRIASFEPYKNYNSEYDEPIYIDVPYELMDKYGFTKKILQKIQDNTYEYGHSISLNDTPKTLTIYGRQG